MRMTSFPRRSMTLTATRRCSPAGNGKEVVPLLFLNETHLKLLGSRGLCFVPVARLAPSGLPDGFAGCGVVDPVGVRFFVGIAEDGALNGLDWDFELVLVHEGSL